MSMPMRDFNRPGATGDTAGRSPGFHILMGAIALSLTLFFLLYFLMPMWNGIVD